MKEKRSLVKFKLLMAYLGITQRKMATLANVSQRAIQSYCQGVAVPHLERAVKLRNILIAKNAMSHSPLPEQEFNLVQLFETIDNESLQRLLALEQARKEKVNDHRNNEN